MISETVVMGALCSSSLNRVKWLEPELTARADSVEYVCMDKKQIAAQHHTAIALRLVATRLALGFEDQSKFAEGAGIAKNTYNQWERGKGRPGLDEALKLCAAYDLTLDWIYRGDASGLPYRIGAQVTARAS